MDARAICIATLALGLCACSFTAPPASSPVAEGSPVDASAVVDAGAGRSDAGRDAPGTPDAALVQVVLRETPSDAVSPGSSVICNAPGAQTTRDGTWRRVFRLTDFGVAGAIQVSQVSFGVDHALHARGITVRVGTYAGSFGAPTLVTSEISPLASTSVDVPDNDAPQQVTAPISARVPAGALLVVDVAAPSLQGIGHFNLGATLGAETAPGYFSSTACSISPQSTVMLGGAGALVIDAAGFRITP